MTTEQLRQEIQRQKELPTLSPDIQRILTCCENPDIPSAELAEVLGASPTITARLLGLANSSFFGQQGNVHTLLQAISILGMVTVRSVAVALALSGVFRTDRCPHFSIQRYWVATILTATMSNALYSRIRNDLRPAGDSVYMAGLLHNLGLLALVQLYPEQMDAALTAYENELCQRQSEVSSLRPKEPGRRLADHIRDRLGADHYEAGVWLGSKWHLPEEILLVTRYRHGRNYRGEYWPLVLLEGICANWSNQILGGREKIDDEAESLSALGISADQAAQVREEMRGKLDAIKEMACGFNGN